MNDKTPSVLDLIKHGDLPPLPGGAAPQPLAGGVPPTGEGAGDEGADDLPEMPSADGLDPETIKLNAEEPVNDTGNGRRLLRWYGRELLHVREVGWHVFDEERGCWQREGGDEMATRFAQSTAERIALEADAITATPGEVRDIEEGAAAEAELEKLERETRGKTPTDEQRARRRDLEKAAARGDEARGNIRKRQIGRRKFGVTAGNVGRCDAMLRAALPFRTVAPEALDADPHAFNVLNGTVRFICERVPDPEAGDNGDGMMSQWRAALYPHDREDLIAKCAAVKFDKDMAAPRFEAFLTRFWPLEPVRRFIQTYLGYAITGLTGEQCLVLFYGLGANGKSTLIDIVCRLIGDYAQTLGFESLADSGFGRRGDQATPDVARLPGARLVRASEPKRGTRFDEAMIKSMTGGEPMLVRHLNKGFFEFRPTFKLVLSANEKPDIAGVDHGIWRRMRLIPCAVTIKDEERRPLAEVLAEFEEEGPGVLNWLIEGALRYLNEGLIVPPEVSEATAEYREEMDPVGGFVRDCVERLDDRDDKAPNVNARDMYEAFVAWCYANGARAWKETAFGRAMGAKGFPRGRTNAVKFYRAVRLHDVPPRPRASEHPPHPADDEVPV